MLVACNSVKKTQKAINSGDYGQAIHTSIENLTKNKSKKGNQSYIILLEEAYRKNSDRELKQIAFLENDDNPVHLESIYRSYVDLHTIQKRIRPLLPLYIRSESRNARFTFKDYNDNVLNSKIALSEYLFNKASDILKNATHKQDYREAYDDLVYLNQINPGFRDTKSMIQQAYTKGQDYVKVSMVNSSEKIIPSKLQEELLNFNTYGLNKQWTTYHTKPLSNMQYDYAMVLALKSIDISPEQITEKQLIKEKQLKDGYRYALDEEGRVLKDSMGTKIRIEKFKTVKCNFYQYTQFKSAKVIGVVTFTDLSTKQTLNSYPLSSEFVFEHVYANYDGDKRALEENLEQMLGTTSVPFPSNEQMVYDASEDLKSRLKSILATQGFR
ncbi:hypothetical protein LCGC14_1115290 [marine sediment metagenome]